MIDYQGVYTAVVVAGVVFALYTYLGYPLLLWLLGLLTKRPRGPTGKWEECPRVSICVPAYNEEEQIEGLIQNLLAIEYPHDRIQILIVSDASTDRTEEIVRSFAEEGVELVRISERGGKTRAENAAAPHLRGEIIVNTDASIRIDSGALRPLLATFQDSAVGLASGRDVSVGPGQSHGNVGESGYVGYEMAVRSLETRVSGIVGASGSFYAIRPHLHCLPLPDSLSRDFGAALLSRERGYRAVSVPEAVCFVPRTNSLRNEFRRKVRTVARGMETLAFKRNLMNPFRFGLFSWMLFSHKVCRWALPWIASAVFIALGLISPQRSWAMALFLAGLLFLLLAGVGWVSSERVRVPRIFSIPAFVLTGNLAAMVAFIRVLRRDSTGIWEPTRREASAKSRESG